MASWIVITAIAAMLLPVAGWAAPQAKIKSTGSYDPNGCGFWGDSETLSITNNEQEVLQKRYCSAYGKSTATIVTDAFSHNYVLLKYAEGHGTNAWTNYLGIYKLTDKLTERGHAVLSEGAGGTSRWFYDYTVDKPKTGGIKLIMTLQIDGTPDPGVTLPDRTQIIGIDLSQPH